MPQNCEHDFPVDGINGFFEVNKGDDKRYLVISKAFQDLSQNVDLLSTASPWMESSLVLSQNGIYLISDPVQKYFVVYLAAIDNREIPL